MPCFINFFHYIVFVSCYSPMLLTWNFNHELLVQTREITCCKCKNVLHNHICPSFQQNNFIPRSVECAKQRRIIIFLTSIMDIDTKVKVAWPQGKKNEPQTRILQLMSHSSFERVWRATRGTVKHWKFYYKSKAKNISLSVPLHTVSFHRQEFSVSFLIWWYNFF